MQNSGNNISRQRVNYIDFIKGAAIIAVVFGHIGCFKDMPVSLPIKDFFAYTWHVPAFFIVSGFFLKDVTYSNFKDFIKKKAKQLNLPALYFYIPAVLLHNILCNIGVYDSTMQSPGITTSFKGLGEIAKQIGLSICCAGREPLLGPIWFVYVLFFAMIGYAIISVVLEKTNRKDCKPLVFLSLAVIGAILSNSYGISIKRCSNTLTAIFLVYIGQYIYQKIKIGFNNGVAACAACLLVYEVSVLSGGVHLNGNKFSDLASMTVGSVAAVYILGYIGQKIEGCAMERFVRFCGKESFSIMALHFSGFKLVTLFLSLLGAPHAPLGELMPTIGNRPVIIIVYLAFGVISPLLFIICCRKIKNSAILIWKHCKRNIWY